MLARGVNPFADAGYDPATAADLEERWQAIQRSHLAVSSDAKLLVAEGAGHDILREKPTLVVKQVTSLVERLREADSP